MNKQEQEIFEKYNKTVRNKLYWKGQSAVYFTQEQLKQAIHEAYEAGYHKAGKDKYQEKGYTDTEDILDKDNGE